MGRSGMIWGISCSVVGLGYGEAGERVGGEVWRGKGLISRVLGESSGSGGKTWDAGATTNSGKNSGMIFDVWKISTIFTENVAGALIAPLWN